MLGLIVGALAVVATAWWRFWRLRQKAAALEQHPNDGPLPPDPW
jgi:hypothetical protein